MLTTRMIACLIAGGLCARAAVSLSVQRNPLFPLPLHAAFRFDSILLPPRNVDSVRVILSESKLDLEGYVMPTSGYYVVSCGSCGINFFFVRDNILYRCVWDRDTWGCEKGSCNAEDVVDKATIMFYMKQWHDARSNDKLVAEFQDDDDQEAWSLMLPP